MPPPTTRFRPSAVAALLAATLLAAGSSSLAGVADETQITSDPATDQRPAFSPDGSQVVFDSDRTGNPDLFLVPSAGGAVTPLTTNPLLDRHPDWSPDGTTIVYSSRESGGSLDPDLWLIPAAGGTPVRLDADPAAEDRFPAWSPDGSQVAYTKNDDIWVIPAAGGTPVQLTSDPAQDFHPTWSPDGAWIAFASSRDGDNELWVVPSAGGAAVRITDHPANDSAPHWSPDGTRLAFQSDRSGQQDIWLVPATGGAAVRVTTDPGQDVQPAWSASGDRIAFARDGNLWVFTFPVDLSVTKTVDDPAPPEGGTVTYTVALANAGPQGATGVEVTDALAAGLTFQSAAATTGTYDAGTGVWTVGAVAAAASDTLTIVAVVDAGTSGTTIGNAASVTAADQLDRSPANDSASVDVAVVAVLAISSAADQTFVEGGPVAAVEPIRVTDDATAPSITAANDIRVRIPAGLAMEWDTADLTATIGGAAAAKVSGTVAYEDLGKTLVLDVLVDFAGGDQIVVADLGFGNFTAASAASLELEVGNDGLVSALDDKTVTILAATDAPAAAAARRWALDAARPSPFRGGTTLAFEVPVATRADLAIYDVSGRLVRSLVRGVVAPGRHVPRWDGRDEVGRPVPAGVYFVRLEAAGFSAARKVIRLP